ncbi:cell wall metabolism sensor histidine kinase WalK [Mucilaginibacter sp. HMF5004]|uniref:HAMP domain-containing sensor histidine kinase n=1 Tax=Mucilaginibacter rivuli TaxID=2857527 RepID=UPI001C5DB5DC|nr:ATP-binding protein [Mucilaginibacter rivuli]MBW4891680.1 cell wall metabolism sensor histidine kinase WalK [Mucilaginibacter rivuli]
MSIKNKLRTGISFLFLLALLCSGFAVYYLQQLSNDSRAILKDNYRTLVYTKNISSLLDAPPALKPNRLKDIQTNLTQQEHNITEKGEKELTDSLQQFFNQYQTAQVNPAAQQALSIKMRDAISGIMTMNMNAIQQKDKKAADTSSRALIIIGLLGSFCFLIGFTFMINFPGYIATPIRELTQSILQIANKNYSKRLMFNSDDEYGELSTAFNQMAKKLSEYETSNLANILFEKRRIETIINAMHDALIGFDDKQIIIFVNEVACNLIGLPEDKLVGQFAPHIADENDLLRNMLITENKKMKIYADDQESYFTKEVLEVTNEDKFIGKVIILKNITEFQQLDEAKTNFIATISHELKTPISSIKMSLKLLEDNRVGEVNTEQRALLENIEDDTKRLLLITGELLDMGQLETGKIQLNFGSTHPKNIVDYAVKAVKFIADQRQVSISIKCDDNLPNVRADLDKSTWVLINLLSNAIKYSREGTTVELLVSKNKGDTITFTVTDHGQGIEQKYLSKIFDRYFKIPGASADQSGTGLGLAIAKDFIEAQQGKISVHSEMGEGSSFQFLLPMG